MLKRKTIYLLLVVLAVPIAKAYAQTVEIDTLLRQFEARAAAGAPGTTEEAEPALDRFESADKQTIAEALPQILGAASSPHVSVRRVAAMALYLITNRPEGRTLLATDYATFAALLGDADIPIRRIGILAIANLQPDANSPIVPVLKNYLAREDAVSTIGAGVATVLMKAAPNDADSTNAIAQFMRRRDQTSLSRNDMLQGIDFAKSHDRKIGKVAATYADDPDDQTSIHAIETLQRMGKDVVVDNQLSLSQAAADAKRAPGVRAAATKALSAVP
jgi:hypothetical protein